MDNDIRGIYFEFDELAKRHFFTIFNKFQDALGDIEKEYDENVFQLSRSKHISLLKKRLEESAVMLMNRYESAEATGRLRFNLTETIGYYLKEFTRKSKLI